MAGALFHPVNLPLTKWFWAIYLAAFDKGGISDLRLPKKITCFGLLRAEYYTRLLLL